MALELRSLRYLVTLSHRLNYGRAAADLGITQSALSRSIQALERHFGAQLFNRDRSGVTPTASGRQLIDHARGLLANADNLEQQFREAAAGRMGELSFGIAPVPARAILAASLRDRLTKAPLARNDVIVRGFDDLWPKLIAGEIEFLVAPSRLIPDFPPVRRERLGSFPVGLFVRRGHPLLNKARVQARFPLLLSSGNLLAFGGQNSTFPHLCEGVHAIEDLGSLVQLCLDTDGIMLTSPYAIRRELACGDLCDASSQGEFRGNFEVMLLSLSQRALSAAAKAMMASLRRQLRALEAAAAS